MPELKLGGILRYGWLIAAVAVMPILRQFIVFKLLHDAQLADFLFLSALVITLTPLAALGWGDLFVGRLALSRDAERTADAPAFTASLVSIVVVAASLFSVLSLRLSWLLAAMAAIDLLFVALLQNSTKILRSFDRMRAFFGWLVAKHVIELALLGIVAATGKASAPALLGVEAVAAAVILLALTLHWRLWRYAEMPSGSGAYLAAALPLAGAFLLNSGVAIVGQNLDRVGLPAVIDDALYSAYLFALINASVLISANAFVFHVTYPRLAAISGNAPALRRYIGRYDRYAHLAGLVMIPLQASIFVLFNDRLYHGPAVTWPQAALATLIGWSYLLQIRETLLITSMQVKFVAMAASASIASFVLAALLLYGAGLLTTLYACFAASIIGRVVYVALLRVFSARVLDRLQVQTAAAAGGAS
jgi:hypothetical protein